MTKTTILILVLALAFISILFLGYKVKLQDKYIQNLFGKYDEILDITSKTQKIFIEKNCELRQELIQSEIRELETKILNDKEKIK